MRGLRWTAPVLVALLFARDAPARGLPAVGATRAVEPTLAAVRRPPRSADWA